MHGLNPGPTSMYLLKKVIQIRENSHPDHEKPFLEHLEDLRVMVTRIVITLLIAMLACFIFNKKLMEFFRHPVDQVLITQLEETLPKTAPEPPTVAIWSKARKVEHAAANLSPEHRETFYRSLNDETIVFHARSIGLLRAANQLLPENQQSFVDSLDADARMKDQVKALLLTSPTTDTDMQGNLKMMSALKPTEGFMLSMKLSFVAGIVVSFPLLLLYVLQFVLPGLHANEKRVLWPAMTVGFGLFLAGAAFAYLLVLPRALLFFYQWSGDMGISNDWRIGEYISFATQFTLLFGLSFELPVVVMVFVKLGLLSYDTMSRTRSYAIVGIFVAAAVLTPTPDMLTMTLMAAPMIVLYEICIWLAYFDNKKSRLQEEQEARESVERQLLREERLREQEEAEAAENPQWHDDIQQKDPHSAEETVESGDDGWNEEFDRRHHMTDELPEIPDGPPTEPPAGPPEDGERRRMDP